MWAFPLFYEVILENREKLDSMVQQACKDAGVELVEMDIFQAGKRKVVRLFVDKEGGITVDDCANCSRSLGTALELDDIIPEAFTLEVSSPGLDRPLKTTRDFQRNLDRLLRITREKGKPISGTLLEVGEEHIVLKPKKAVGPTKSTEPLRILRAEILVAKVDVEI